MWDAVSNQNFFSFEAFQHVLAQLSNMQRQPDIPTPYYKTLRKYKEFEIRRLPLATCNLFVYVESIRHALLCGFMSTDS